MQFTVQFDTVSAMVEFFHALANGACLREQLNRIELKQDVLIRGEGKIMSTQDEAKTALNKIDAATTQAANNIATLATTAQTISDEMDALETKIASGSIPADLVSQISAAGDRAQAVADSLTAHATFLTGVASKGVDQPLTVPVPPAPDIPAA